jgi:predicted metal-dependent peptidase
MDTEERLVKAKIKLQSRSPFFSYLALYVKFRKVDKNALGGTYTMGVSPDGILYYNDEWIESLTDEEIIGVLCHEILHLSLLHLLRRGNREHDKWNIAVDLAVNKILIDDGFDLPKGGLIPDSYGEFKFPAHMLKNEKQYTIKDLKGKTGEMIYEELPEFASRKSGTIYVKGFDMHSEEKGQGKKGEGEGKGEEKIVGRELTGTEKSEMENEWLNRLEEAYVSAKQRGNVPAGIERYIDEIKKSQINWKALLQKYVQALIPNDFTWLRRSKRSVATGIYLPNVKKEKIDVCVGIDLSGSIGKDKLTEFLSEIIGLAKAYQSAITMRLLTHDVDVHNDYIIANGNVAKIKALKLKGGGGTSHKPIFDYVKEKVKDCRAVIFFTDGYSDIKDIDFKKYNFNKIFVINKFGDDECVKDRSDCISIKMKKNGR